MTYPNTANSSLCCFSPDFFLQHKTSKMTVWGHSTLKSRINSALKGRINKYEGMFFWKTEIKILKNKIIVDFIWDDPSLLQYFSFLKHYFMWGSTATI